MIKLALVASLVLLCVSCTHTGRSTLTRQQRDEIQQVVDGEAGDFSTCRTCQIDLNKDGTPETVFTFAVGLRGSQIRVLQWRAEQSTVLFDDGSNTPNTVFCLAEDVPTAVLERVDRVGEEATQLVYQWDGQAFMPSLAGGCVQEQDNLRWLSCSSAAQ